MTRYWLPIMRLGEQYQFYSYDASFRALPLGEKAAFEVQFAESVKMTAFSKASIEPFCESVALPDGSTYRPTDGVALLARNWAACADCEKPRWFLESLVQVYHLCEAQNDKPRSSDKRSRRPKSYVYANVLSAWLNAMLWTAPPQPRPSWGPRMEQLLLEAVIVIRGTGTAILAYCWLVILA
jgi:hypothetical protein